MHCVLHDRNIAMLRQDLPDLDMTTLVRIAAACDDASRQTDDASRVMHQDS